MCGRYFIEQTDANEALDALLTELNRRGQHIKTGEIFPSDSAMVIANSKRLTAAPFAMRWGYKSGDGRRIINARSETAAQKPLFLDGIINRRCLVPASGYYEWARRSREKTKYEITDPLSPLLCMAGIYRLTPGGAEFTILTREPGESLSFLHDRMPVILPLSCQADWLNPHLSAADVLKNAITDLAPHPLPGQAQTISFFDLEM